MMGKELRFEMLEPIVVYLGVVDVELFIAELLAIRDFVRRLKDARDRLANR